MVKKYPQIVPRTYPYFSVKMEIESCSIYLRSTTDRYHLILTRELDINNRIMFHHHLTQIHHFENDQSENRTDQEFFTEYFILRENTDTDKSAIIQRLSSY
jgi:hypothetical protein